MRFKTGPSRLSSFIYVFAKKLEESCEGVFWICGQPGTFHANHTVTGIRLTLVSNARVSHEFRPRINKLSNIFNASRVPVATRCHSPMPTNGCGSYRSECYDTIL